MNGFFYCYSIIYYIDLIQFIVFGKLFNFKSILDPGNYLVSTLYLATLDLLSFIAVSYLYITKDLSGLIDLILIRIETLAAYLYIYISRRFYIPIYTHFGLNAILAGSFYYYWPVIYNIVLQSYSKKIGVDIKIRNIYIIRHVYIGIKRLSYISYLLLLFSHLASGLHEKYVVYRKLPMFILIIIIKTLSRSEEEEENRRVKLLVILLLIIVLTELIIATIIRLVLKYKSEYQFLYYINCIHFILATILSIFDYWNYNKGLKEAIKYKKNYTSRRL